MLIDNFSFEKTIQRSTSVDSLEQTDLTSTICESLHYVSGYHKWINTDDKIRVENYHHHENTKNQIDFLINTDDENSIQQKTLSTNKSENEEEENNDDNSLSHMDISLNHFDVQLQVNNGQLEQATRYGVFSSILSNSDQPEKVFSFKINHSSQTPEMDMENGNHSNGRTNGYHQHRQNNDESHRRNRQMNGSPSSNGGGNGYNNNSRR